MKLVRYGSTGIEKPGLISEDGQLRDISSVVSEIDGHWMRSEGTEALAKEINSNIEQFPLVLKENLRIGAPMARPGNIIAIGLNYEDHAVEAGMDIPDEPVIFCKAPSSYSGPYDPILVPPKSIKTDWEVELGIVIGREAKYISNKEEALKYIFGYCIVNDVSERKLQLEHGPTWIQGKSAQSFCPTGPWLVTADEVKDPNNLYMKTTVNGTVRQNGSSKTMIFDIAHIVWYCSQFMVLEPGDLIATGTPPGVGMGYNPPVYLTEGDIVELEIEGLGKQKQSVILTQ